MTRKQRGLLLVLGLLAVAAISVWHIQSLMQSGQPVFWLAELWAPVGVLSIGVVSCLEYLLPGPGGPVKTSQKPGAKRLRSRS
jgi:hypothetical protein